MFLKASLEFFIHSILNCQKLITEKMLKIHFRLEKCLARPKIIWGGSFLFRKLKIHSLHSSVAQTIYGDSDIHSNLKSI